MRRKSAFPFICLVALFAIGFQVAIPAYAEDFCAWLEKIVNDLRKDAEFLEPKWQAAEREYISAVKHAFSNAKSVIEKSEELAQQVNIARSEVMKKTAGTIAEEVLESLALMFIAPELLPTKVITIVDAGDSLKAAYDMITLVQMAKAMINELDATIASGMELREAAKFAKKYDLPELAKLVRQYEDFPSWKRSLEGQTERWQKAALEAELFKSLLHGKRVELQIMAEQLDICMQDQQQAQEKDSCGKGGGFVCR